MTDGHALWIDAEDDPLEEDFGLPEYPALAYRMRDALAMMPGSSRVRMRAGRRLGLGLELTISPDGLEFTVQAGLAAVDHALGSGGSYVLALPTATTKVFADLAAAKPPSGFQRRDLIIYEAMDETVAGKPTTLREARLNLVVGDEVAGSPTAPALPAMAHAVGQVAWNGNDAPTVHPTNPQFTCAAGGILPVHSQAERDALFAYDGLKIYRTDLDEFQSHKGGVWSDDVLEPEDTGWLENVDGTVFGNYPLSWNPQGSRIRKIGNRVRFEVAVEREGGTLGPGNFTDEPVHSIQDSAYLPGDAGPLFAVGHGGGGTVGFRLQDEDLWAVSSQFAVHSLDVVRVVMEWLTD